VPNGESDDEIIAKLRVHALAHRPSEVRQFLEVLKPVGTSHTAVDFLWRAFNRHVPLRIVVEAVGATRGDEAFDAVFAPYWPGLQADFRHRFSLGEDL
jgi:hypothetical protein